MVVPPAGGQFTEICPRCASIMRFAIGNPRPVPPVFVVKNGVKTCPRISAGIPGPSSVNAISQPDSIVSMRPRCGNEGQFALGSLSSLELMTEPGDRESVASALS